MAVFLITASLTSGVVQPLLLVTPLVPEKAFGEEVFLNRADCLVSDDGFCGAFELAAYQNDLKPA